MKDQFFKQSPSTTKLCTYYVIWNFRNFPLIVGTFIGQMGYKWTLNGQDSLSKFSFVFLSFIKVIW